MQQDDDTTTEFAPREATRAATRCRAGQPTVWRTDGRQDKVRAHRATPSTVPYCLRTHNPSTTTSLTPTPMPMPTRRRTEEHCRTRSATWTRRHARGCFGGHPVRSVMHRDLQASRTLLSARYTRRRRGRIPARRATRRTASLAGKRRRSCAVTTRCTVTVRGVCACVCVRRAGRMPCVGVVCTRNETTMKDACCALRLQRVAQSRPPTPGRLWTAPRRTPRSVPAETTRFPWSPRALGTDVALRRTSTAGPASHQTPADRRPRPCPGRRASWHRDIVFTVLSNDARRWCDAERIAVSRAD